MGLRPTTTTWSPSSLTISLKMGEAAARGTREGLPPSSEAPVFPFSISPISALTFATLLLFKGSLVEDLVETTLADLLTLLLLSICARTASSLATG